MRPIFVQMGPIDVVCTVFHGAELGVGALVPTGFIGING